MRKLVVDGIGPVAEISIAPLFGTALWFSANSTAGNLVNILHISAADIGRLTSAMQLGFHPWHLRRFAERRRRSDRASRIFVCSALAGALFNLGFAWLAMDLVSAALLRFGVGICLACIYPMGTKLIIGWATDRTGQALAQLVGIADSRQCAASM
ncbi:hypothetical protein [Paraburkholderia youngii]|uniref:hypothetical protein n=1 Tax=Paraburkholderia youngii TaxID=2782701 RepID=UPI003D201397